MSDTALVIVDMPADGCAFLTKARHSVFYATALDYLLQRLGTKTLILAGQVTEQCILYSALDGCLRHFEVVVPIGAVAHIDEYLGTAALAMMERNMDARVVESSQCLPRASEGAYGTTSAYPENEELTARERPE